MNIRVVTVTFNSANCIRACVDSVLAQKGVPVEMTVVDNWSSDATRDLLRSYGDRIHVIENDDNAGFGRGCNLGARGAGTTFLYLLNPDASLPDPGALLNLMNAMLSHGKWGVCGTRVQGEHELPCQPHYPGERHLKRPLGPLPGDIAWILGASMFFRREVFESVKGFDERIFLYAEEIDICLRTRRAGWEIGMVPEVEIRHAGGDSERSFSPQSTWQRKLEGLSQFYRNHYDEADVRRLWRRDFNRARWRHFWNRLTGGSRGKIAKYAALRDVAAEQLSRLG